MQKIAIFLLLQLTTAFALSAQDAGSWQLTKVDALNTSGDEYAPRIVSGGLLYSRSPVVGDERVALRTEIMFSSFRQNGFQEGQTFSEELSSPLHESHASVGPNEEFVVFSRNSPFKKSAKNFLYLSKVGTYEYQDAEPLPFNDPRFNSTHPSLDASGKRLLFASDRPGGFGGFDLYYAEYKNGVWSSPINLGEDVNSASDEIFPYWGGNNQISFSSNRPGGLGGIDLYLLDVSGNTWKGVKHLDRPFSSEGDDHGLTWSIEQGKGFLSSNREGGAGGDDIYSFLFSAESPISWMSMVEPNQQLLVLNAGSKVVASLDDANQWHGPLSNAINLTDFGKTSLERQFCGEFIKGNGIEPDTLFMKSAQIETVHADLVCPLSEVVLRNPLDADESFLTDASGTVCIPIPKRKQTWIVEKIGFTPQTVEIDPRLPYVRVSLKPIQPLDTITFRKVFEANRRISHVLKDKVEDYIDAAGPMSGYQLIRADVTVLANQTPKSVRLQSEHLTNLITKAMPSHSSLSTTSTGLSLYSDRGQRERLNMDSQAEASVEVELQLQRIPSEPGIGLNID